MPEGQLFKFLKLIQFFILKSSFIECALKWDTFSEKNPFYIDIDTNSFHTILTYLNCHQEANSGDVQAQKYLTIIRK